MKKFLKRLSVILLIFFVVIILALVIIAGLFEGKVGKKITSEINKQLTSELVIQDFDLSVIRTFPNIGANFQGVRLRDSRDGNLLEAEEISFRFGVWSLLSSNIKVRSVVISNGALNVQIDKKGNPNYDIFKSSGEEGTESGESSSTAISLEQASLENIELIYEDASAKQEIAALVESANFSGKFSSDQFTLKSDAEISTRFADLEGIRYLPGKKLNYDASIAINLKEGIYELEEVLLDIEGNAFRLDGNIESWDSGTYFDLFVTNDNGQLEGVINLLPAAYLEGAEGIESTGQFALNGLVKGQYNQKQNPEVRVEFSLDEGRLSLPQLNNPLKDVSFNAVFSNGKYRDNSSTSFTIEQFKAYFNRELVEMRLQVNNFDDPRIDFFLDGVVPLNSAYGLFGNPGITDGSGEIEIKRLVINGDYEDMINPSRIAQVKASGALEFDDAGLKINEEEMLIDRGVLTLEGNRLAIDGLRLEGAGSDISFKGYAFNVLPVLFADSLNSRHVELEFDASLTADKLDIDRLIGLSTLSESEEDAPEVVQDSLKEANVQSRARITSFLNGSFNADIEEFNFNKIVGESFRGTLEFNNSTMEIKGSVNAFDGNIDLDGTALFDEKPSLKARMTCKQLNVTKLFNQAENFGQDVLMGKNLEGDLNAKVAIFSYWDEKGNFLMDKLRVLSGVKIEEGELEDFKMLEDFSTFVNIKDLRRIKFVDLQNFMEIRNERFYLPAMFIRSNALNLTISGEHSFEHEIKYNIQVNAGQVMADRFKRHDPKLAPKPAKKNGWFNLYYSVLGTLDDYNIKSAKRRVKSDFELSEIRKRDIRKALQQEFGAIDLVDEPVEWRDDYSSSPEEEEYLDFDMDGGE
ncbi:MAG: AsmA family protein [Chitinophagales bacterium]|nr:AsmA family protein [Chitinophagales bacterium]